MASILKVRDADGTVHEIYALQGKSAYQYAQESGYTGTEEEFAAKLASEYKINPIPKTDEMTIPVGVDENGQLWVAPIGSSSGEDTGIAVESVTLNQTEITVGTGATVQLAATVLPEDATDKTLECYSSNEQIATVDETGLVTGVAEGKCKILAVANSGAYAEANVNIEKAFIWDVNWDYTMGLPEDNGFTVTNPENAAMQSDGLVLTKSYLAATGKLSTGKAIVEVEYVQIKPSYAGNTTGFYFTLCDGTNFMTAYRTGNGLFVVIDRKGSAGGPAKTLISDVDSGDNHVMRFELDPESGLSIYSDGVLATTLSVYSYKSSDSIAFGYSSSTSGASTKIKAYRLKIS